MLIQQPSSQRYTRHGDEETRENNGDVWRACVFFTFNRPFYLVYFRHTQCPC